MPSKMFHRQDKSDREESNTTTDRPAVVDGTYDSEISNGDSGNTSGFMSGLCQSLKNVHQYRIDMIEKIKNQLRTQSIYFRNKR